MNQDAQTVSMTSQQVNLIIKQGDSRAFTVTFPVSVVLTGSSAKMVVKKRDGSTALTLQIGSGITLAGQVFTVALTSTQTAALAPETVYLYDFEWTDSASKKTTVVAGLLTVQKQIAV